MKSWNYLFFTVLSAVSSVVTYSQENKTVKVIFSGYVDIFYSFNFNQPVKLQSNTFLYNYNRHNEFNLNIGLLRARFEYENAYASFAIHSGTYVEDNYANEKIKYINESYIGLYLDKNKKHTLEVGIMPSYIGFETATTASNLTLTRSILAENTPYYMAGVKLNHEFSSKWSLSEILSNGWQKINKPNRKALPSVGTQLVYKPNDRNTINWSTYIGDEPINDLLRTRYFNNFYWNYQWNSKWRTILGFDFGFQKQVTESNFDNWYSPILLIQYAINKKWQSCFRAEYYQDKNNSIIAGNNEFKTTGTSVNIDFLPTSKIKFRTEAKLYNSKELFFQHNNQLVKNDLLLTTSLSFDF